MSKLDPAKVNAKFPRGSKWTYFNPGKRGCGNEAEVVAYLCRYDQPDKITHIELAFSVGRRHIVTVNQLGKYYQPKQPTTHEQ